ARVEREQAPELVGEVVFVQLLHAQLAEVDVADVVAVAHGNGEVEVVHAVRPATGRHAFAAPGQDRVGDGLHLGDAVAPDLPGLDLQALDLTAGALELAHEPSVVA